MIQQTFTFPGAPRVKKNQKRIVKIGKFKKIISSKLYLEYEESSLLYLASYYKRYKLTYPVYCHFRFYVETRRKFDLGNMSEGIADILQQGGFIRDDDYKHFIPVFHSEHSGVHIDKENPRSVVILTDEDYKLTKPFELDGKH